MNQCDETANIISFSGGKDSTAMALLMLENDIPIHSVVAFDTGWEFPGMYDHWKLFEQKTGLKIEVLKSEKPFSYWMFERPVVARKGPNKGKVHRVGNGWPSPTRRWCTREKVRQIQAYQKTINNGVSCIGMGWDEQHRVKHNSHKLKRYPLIEWGITEKQALKICRGYGFDWSGLYDVFDRVSCFCCPLQSLGNLRLLRRYYPEQWNQMLEWDLMRPASNKGFLKYKTVHDLDRRFACEDKQKTFWGVK
jgi:3'-phosphoadenosine 5'-phosphosulfate sulfotransferase (PAPS reductase)/FAD synthetase